MFFLKKRLAKVKAIILFIYVEFYVSDTSTQGLNLDLGVLLDTPVITMFFDSISNLSVVFI